KRGHTISILVSQNTDGMPSCSTAQTKQKLFPRVPADGQRRGHNRKSAYLLLTPIGTRGRILTRTQLFFCTPGLREPSCEGQAVGRFGAKLAARSSLVSCGTSSRGVRPHPAALRPGWPLRAGTAERLLAGLRICNVSSKLSSFLRPGTYDHAISHPG